MNITTTKYRLAITLLRDEDGDETEHAMSVSSVVHEAKGGQSLAECLACEIGILLAQLEYRGLTINEGDPVQAFTDSYNESIEAYRYQMRGCDNHIH